MRYLWLCGILVTFATTVWGEQSDLKSAHNQALRKWKNPWKMALEKNGILDYSVPRPYRYAIPLTTLGSEDNKLMLTYATSMPGDSGAKGFLLFAKIPLD